jgi:ubiquinone/menaquinone biosynthesis C-methylase UbiE
VSFDSLAPFYHALEWIAFGDALQHCRTACLGEISQPRRALLLGEGNGRFLSQLLKVHPEVEVDYLDSSARMLQLAKRRLERTRSESVGRVRFLKEEIASWNAPIERYDLVVTHFVFDCFPEAELKAIIKKLGRAATPDASWLLADFSLPAKGLARVNAAVWLSAMYAFFRLTTHINARELVDPTPVIRAENFVLCRRYDSNRGLLKSELWRR